jgi:hypothetical protein
MIHLINITALPPGSTTPTTLRFCSGAAGFVSTPSDTPANAVWRPGVNVAYHFTRELFGGSDAGASRVGAGEIELTNDDGRLDLYDYQDWGLDGQAVQVLAGEAGQGLSQFVPVFKGVVESVEFSWKAMTLNIRDRQKELDQPLPIPKYAGTDSGATGVEGKDDLKGKVKPLALGSCANVTPVFVNSSSVIYQVSYRAVQGIPAVYSNGSALTHDGDSADAAALAAASIASGHYRTCLALGLFRVNTTAGTKITADVLGDSQGGYVDTLAGTIGRVLAIRGWSAGADWSAASLSALASAAPAVIGLYDDSGAKVRAILDALCAGAWAWYCPDRLGVMHFGQIVAPSGTPVLTITDTYHQNLERVSDDITGAPWGLVTCKFGKNWTPMKDNDVAAVVGADRRAWLAEEYRAATSTTDGAPDATVTARHPLAEQVEFESLFSVRADALAEAQRRAAFRASPRRAFRFTLDPKYASSLELGDVVALTSRRQGLSGTLCVVSGLEELPAKSRTEVTVYA